MNLTAQYHRIAIPWGVKCPHCLQDIPDLMVELLNPTDRADLMHGDVALKCPLCHEPLTFPHGFHKDPVSGTDLPLVAWDKKRWNSYEPERQQYLLNHNPQILELLA